MLKLKLKLYKFLGKFIPYFKQKVMRETIDMITNLITENLKANGYNIAHRIEINNNNIAYCITFTIPMNSEHYILSAKLQNDNGNAHISYKIYIDNNINLNYFSSTHFDNLDEERRKITDILQSIVNNNKILFLSA